jgi:hypothetical protein
MERWGKGKGQRLGRRQKGRWSKIIRDSPPSRKVSGVRN